MSRPRPLHPWLSLWTLLLAWLLALPADAAKLVPEKTAIAVGETVYVKLDADLALGVNWTAGSELQILASDGSGATVKGVKAGTATITAKWLGGKKSAQISVGDVAASKDQPEDDKEAVKLEGLARAMGMPDLDARIARMLFEVNTGKRTPKQFYEGLARAGGNMFDVIKVRSRLVDHADQSFTRQVMGPTFSENGTPVEQKILTWRRQETLAAIDEVVKRFVDSGRVPADGYALLISHVGKWANQADRSLTFTGDIDFSFVSNDTALAEAMKEAYAEVIKRRTGLDPKSLDSVCTAHGKAGLEVYIGRHGMAFAEEQMKINELVDMSTGARTRQDLDQVAHQLTSERDLAASQGKELPKPALNTEPGLSMEMARHFQHDIVGPRLFDVGNAIVKAAKYLDRSYKALDKAGGQPADPGMAAFARRITELANAKPQTRATRDETLRLISEQLGSPARTTWDMGTQKLVLSIDAAAVERFHQAAGRALWDTVRQGSNKRTTELDQRLRDLLDRQNKGDKVDEDVAKLRQEMVDLVDMVEAEVKAAHGADIPIEVHTNNAKVRAMLDTLSKRFGVKKLSAEELKDKKFVEELLKAEMAHPDPSRLKMVAGYIMDRTARAAELSMSGVEKTNQLLDIIDDRLLGPLRGDSEFADFEAEMKLVRQANMDPRLRPESMGRLSALKIRVASNIKATNMYLNEKLQATAAGRQGMKFMMVYGLVDEMQAYRDAFNEKGWGGFATEIFKRRIPFGGAVESAVMGNTLRAGWDVVTTLIPPLALPEAAYGLGTMIGTQVKSTYWSEQLALFTDSLYADAIFKVEGEQQYEKAKVNVYRLVRTFHNNMPLDLHRFAEMRKDQVEALAKEVETGRVNWQAYKNNFKGLTEWLDVDATLKANLAASDPALMLLEEMANHEAVGPRLMDRLAEKGLARWEQVKLGYVVKLIKHLEERKQADDALGRGALPELFAELRKVAADLAIEDEVMKGLDTEVDTSNLKGLIKWLWDVKRGALGQAPTESETTRAAQVVKKYLDAYKQVQALRDQAAGQLAKAAVDVNTRYLTTGLFLTGRADPDLAAARSWIGQIETARKAMANAILAIKRSFLAKAGLDSADQPYLDRAFAHEVWIKPYQDGNARLKKAWMADYAAGHVKERDKVLAEYKDWLTKLGPVQLTVTATDAKDAKKKVSGLKIALAPTDELGKPVSASAGGNQVVMAVPMGRYSLTASAPGYYDATRSVVYGRGLTATPSENIALTPTGKDPDKDKDKDKDGKPDDGGQDGASTVIGPDGKPARPAKQGAGGSASGQFPGEPFNGMQISYGFSGCSLPEMTDKPGFTTSRTYKGRLGSGTMTVSGSARMGAGYGATLSVSVSAGGEHKEHKVYIKSGFPGFNTASFNLTIPIPATATSGGFGIRMDGEYNAGGRGLVVSGSCTADGPEGAAPKGTGELSVDLSGPKEPVPLGKEAEVSASAKGGRFPYSYAWSGAAGSAERAKVKITRPGSQQVAVTVSDSEGKRAGANLTIKVALLKLELAGLPGQAYYGSRSRLEVKGLPDFQPAPDPCAGREYTGSNPFDECIRIRNIKTVQTASPSGVPPPEIRPSDVGRTTAPARVNPEAKEGAYRFVWQSEPGLTFEPPTSTDGTTWVTYDRMGQVKVWAEVHQMIEGAWQTIGETEQKTVNVVAPAFSLQFTPPDGQGKVGQEVRAKIVAKPEVPDKLIDYRWFDPASGNRMEYTQNAGEIGFKIKDTKPMKLDALARVPHHGDEIAKIAGSYTGVAYDVKISPPKARGPQLQVWVCDTQLGNARNCGMKDIPQGQFATFQDIFLTAQVTPAPQSPRYRWTVDPSGSCGLPGSGSELRLNCSNTGSHTVRLQVADADNILLGEAETAVSVSVSDNDVKQAPKSREAWEKLQQAKQQANDGQLDPAINLANAATGLDPKNTEAKDLAKRWSNERTSVIQQLDRAKKALQANKPDDAQKEIDAAKKLHPKYPPVLDVEKQLADKRKGQGISGKQPAETGAMPPAVGAVQPVSLAGVGGNRGTVRTVKGVAIDDSSWIRFKSTDENRRSLDIPVPAPTRAAAVAIVSNLDDATYLEQGKTIARIIVSKDTGDEALDIQAGVHSSEWNYGVGPKHKRVDGADIGDNRFLVVLPLARPGVVKGLRIEYVETNAPKWSGHAPGFCLRGVSLVADTAGLSLTPPAGQAAATPPLGGGATAAVAGKWRTSEGELTLTQSGRAVKGSYSNDGGEIVGEMNGNVLEGYWIENGSAERCTTAKNGRFHWGRIRWAFDGNKFAGTWSYCDKPVASGGGWNGERIGDVPAGYVPPAGTAGAASSGGKAAGIASDEEWTVVETTPGMYRLERSSGEARIARQANNPGGLQHAGLRLNRGLPVTGDFTAQVSFADARIDGGLNQIELQATFADGGIFYVVRDRERSGSHIWAPNLQGDAPCGRAGTLRMERRGETVTGYCDGRAIWSAPRKAALTRLQFVLQNNASNDPISATFRDWRFSAAAGSSPAQPTPAGGGLIAAYALDGDGRDASGNNRHGNVQGAKATADRFGRAGGAMLFDGKSFIELPLDINPGALPRLTFTAWVRADDASPVRQVMSHDNGGYDRSLGIDTRGGGHGWSAFAGSGGVLGFRPVEKGRWTFVAAVWDQPARKVRLVVDDTVMEKDGEAGGSDRKPSLGRNPGYGEHFIGAIDDVRFHGRALDMGEIRAIRGGQDAVDMPSGRDYTYRDGGRDYTYRDGGRDYTYRDGGRAQGGYLRIEACVDGSDWIGIEDGRLTHRHRGFDQIGTHGGCPASHKVAGGGFLVDGLPIALNRLPLPVGFSGIGRFEVERGRGQVRMDGANRILLDDDGPGGSDVYIVRLYPTAAAPATPSGQGTVSFDNGNIGGVGNGPSQPTVFTFNEARVLTLIQNYHWNSARGATPGSIAVREAGGRVYGPWPANGSPGQGGVPNAYWTARPNITLPAGTYTVIDSEPASWSHNSQSGNRGFTRVESYPAGADAMPGGRDYTSAPARSQLLFEVGNIGGVANGPTKATRFTLSASHVITLIRNYHWNSARGATPGNIAVRDGNGRTWGPWPASGSPGQGGVPNAYWTATPNVTLPAGTYTVVDSDPASWSHNAESGNRGFVRVEGYPADPGQPGSQAITGNAKVDGAIKQVDELLDAVKSLKGLFGK
jgi:hypothetical protein